jgi:hypothetical protein
MKRGIKVKNKHAQSQIITTVLIILLVLFSIVIVWNVVDDLVKDSSEQVEVSQFFLKGEIKSYGLPDDHSNTTVEVQRGAGKGEINGVKLIFKNSANSYSYENTTAFPGELESEIYVVTNNSLSITNFTSITEVDVHFMYGDDKVTGSLDTYEV